MDIRTSNSQHEYATWDAEQTQQIRFVSLEFELHIDRTKLKHMIN